MRQNLNVITLGTQDLARSIQFYERLGWNVTSAPGEDIAFFQAGGVVLALYPRKLLAEDAKVDGEGHGFPGITLAHCTRSEQEVDQVVQDVERAGGKILKPPQKTFWGGYGAYFQDPDGFPWEVAHNPAWAFDPDGNVDLRRS